MNLRNPPLFYLFLIFVIVNIVDGVTAWFILPGEVNPIYILTGSVLFIYLAKLLIIVAIWYYYRRNKYPSHFLYYILVMILVLGSLALMIGIYSNAIGIMNPALLEEASQIPNQEKVSAYITVMTFIYVLPMVFSLFAFWIYSKSLNYIIIDKKYFKRRKWWQP